MAQGEAIEAMAQIGGFAPPVPVSGHGALAVRWFRLLTQICINPWITRHGAMASWSRFRPHQRQEAAWEKTPRPTLF